MNQTNNQTNNFTNFNIKFKKTYVYYRVSNKRQANDLDNQQTNNYDNQPNGLDNQTDLCDEYALKILKTSESNIDYYCDIASSYNNPNALKELNKLAKNLEPNSVILIYSVSRLGRNTFQVFKLLRTIKKLNSCIIAVNDNLCYNNNNRMMDKKFYHKIIDAELSSDYKSERSKNHIINLKKNGGFIGRPPYGYKIYKKNNIPALIENKDEFSIINLIKDQFKILQNYTLVADYLNTNNILKRNDYFFKLFNNLKNILYI